MTDTPGRFVAAWSLRSDTVYLNHGSFGPPPRCVRQARQTWIDRLDEQPMDFFVRRLEPSLAQAKDALARFVGSRTDDLAFVENATAGMNLVAASVPLTATDEVLLTDHEYGAVRRIWERACRRAGATLRTVALPGTFDDPDETVDAIVAAVTDHTRLLVVSHITSPTAVILPVAAICRRVRQRGVRVCIDGPHAVAMLPLDLAALECDYYTASCHKWLCAPFGSGFVYVHSRWEQEVEPAVLSWGRVQPAVPQRWTDELVWTGTRDPSAYLSVPSAIEFLEGVPLDGFRRQTHELVCYARDRIVERTGRAPLVADAANFGRPQWFGSMIALPLPPGESDPLQRALWERFSIEIPVVDFGGGRHLRVSCHLYNTREHVDRLVAALATLLDEGL